MLQEMTKHKKRILMDRSIVVVVVVLVVAIVEVAAVVEVERDIGDKAEVLGSTCSAPVVVEAWPEAAGEV